MKDFHENVENGTSKLMFENKNKLSPLSFGTEWKVKLKLFEEIFD